MQKLSSVLLVDDDSADNFLNKLLLTKLGAAERVAVAEDGTQALDFITQQAGPDEPALILLDVNMPGMSGIQFLEEYKQLPPASAGPRSLSCSPPRWTRATWAASQS